MPSLSPLRALSAACALFAAASLRTGVDVEIPAAGGCWDPGSRHLCLDAWQIADKNATFDVTCDPGAGGPALAWCAFGFNVQIPSPRVWGMAPSEIIFLSVLSSGEVVVEDRVAPTAAKPACFSRQLTYLVKGAVDASGVLRATVTRPVFLDASLLALGYTDLNRTVPTVAAYNSGSDRQTVSCSSSINYHTNQWSNRTIAFL